MNDWIARAAAGLVVAACVALAARRAGSLSASGAVAAAAVGGAAVGAGWSWGALLIIYFVVASALSHLGAAEKAHHTHGIVEKGGARDATQVLANGGVFTLLVLASALASSPAMRSILALAAVSTLAAATADTWATEVGTLFGGTPRALLTGRAAPPGTSGAVSAIGTAAMVAGAVFAAGVANLLGLTRPIATVALAGCIGALADTLIGATVQERRWCDHCGHATERRIHDCGTATRCIGGHARVDNDVVNAAATIVGALAAVLLAFVS